MKLEQIRIKPRLIGAFLVVAIIAGIIGWRGIAGLTFASQQYKVVAEVHLPAVEAFSRLQTAMYAIWIAERGLVNRRMMEPQIRQAQYRWIDKYHGIADEQWKELESLNMSEEAKKRLDEFRPLWAEWKSKHEQVVSLSREKDRLVAAGNSLKSEAVEKLDATVFKASLDTRESALAVAAKLEDLVKAENEDVAAATTAMDSAMSSAVRTGVILMLFGVAVAIAFGVFIAMSVVKPIEAATAALKDIAEGEGDLTQRLEVSGRDEIAELATWFNTFVAKIHDSIVQLARTSQRVAASAQEMSATAQETGRASQQIAQTIEDVARGSTEQSTQVEKASADIQELSRVIAELSASARQQAEVVESAVASVREITDGISRVAGTAETVAQSSTEVAQVARAGQESVEKTVAGMDRIRQATAAAAEAIRQLGDSSQQIGAIVEAIDDIAEQTNLLALNAAIEAARAGEHGKGFAVVADEVRKLAERSSKETKEIANLIAQIQSVTQEAVQAMEAGSREVESGTQLSAEAGEALERITSAVESVVVQIQQVSGAVETVNSSSAVVSQAIETVSEQTRQSTAAADTMGEFSAQVLRSTEEVAAISQANAAAAQEVSAATQEQNASVEELSASAEELARSAVELQELVNQFKVDERLTESAPGQTVELRTVRGTSARKAA
ncbi:MAG: methyl-accepting chemotaxis protein [Armatimonadota bacterium]